jgi:dihydroflavonol-4-reductase
MGNTVLVTGANGHLGFNLAKALRERGHEVRCSVRDAHDEAKTAHLRKADLSDFVSLDVTDGRQFLEVSAGIDTLFHVAATYK